MLKAGGEGEDRSGLGGNADSMNGDEFEQALRVDDRQGSLVCCSPWSQKESDTTEQLN